MLHYRLCFLQCDWWREISLQKVININEAGGISQLSPDPLLLGGVRGLDCIKKIDIRLSVFLGKHCTIPLWSIYSQNSEVKAGLDIHDRIVK